jgi:nitrilase
VTDGVESRYRVAAVQVPPVILDRAATLARAEALINEAADAGARLVVFPESWVSGYPEWVWRLRPGNDYATSSEIWGTFVEASVDLDGDGLAPVRAVARGRGVTVAMGVNERDGRFSRSSIYSTLVIIGPDGEVLLRHRKLVPTNPERMVWAPGDGVGLEAVDTPVGRVGGLVCWENYMPLARFALFASGVQVYLAPTWDEGETWIASMRHIAVEGRCWVIGGGNAMRASDMPSDLPGRAEIYPDPDEWINPGDSVIVSPAGEIVAGPLHQAEGILYAECDPALSARAHRVIDVAGHYGRPDVFHLTVDRSPRSPIA